MSEQQKLIRAILVSKLGMDRVIEAEKRLCGSCRFQSCGVMCEPNPTLLPLTSDGQDCPYFIPIGAVGG